MSSSVNYPGVYVEELPAGIHAITGVPTAITAFIGRAARGPVNAATAVHDIGEFELQFGGSCEGSQLHSAVRDFFLNGGCHAVVVRLDGDGRRAGGKRAGASDAVELTFADDFSPPEAEERKVGLYALAQVDVFNLLCIPPYTKAGDVEQSTVAAAAEYCERRRAFLIVDPPVAWRSAGDAEAGMRSGVGTASPNAAIYFPRFRRPNPLHGDQLESFAPCGAIAGVFARTDASRGVWKAPAGREATLENVPELAVDLTEAQNGALNPLGLNCLRSFPAAGRVIWGARTLQGDDRSGSEWKFVPVRRVALFVEESLYRGTQWVVFEPNDEQLWARVRLNVGAFMHSLFAQGAFQGTTPRDAYFVKCDKETTTQGDIERGVANIVVGFAALKPAEFVVIRIQQLAKPIET